MTYRVNEIFYSLQGEGVRAGTPNVFLRFTGCNLTCMKETHGFDCDTEFASGRDLTIDEIIAALAECLDDAASSQRDDASVCQMVRNADPTNAASASGRVRTADHLPPSTAQNKADQNGNVNGRRDHSISARDSVANTDGTNWIILTGGEPALQVDDDLIRALHATGYKLAIETNGSIALPDGIDWVTVSPKVAEHAIRQRTADEVKYVRGYGQAIPKTVVDAKHKLISPAFDGNVLQEKTLAWCKQLIRDNPEWQLSMQMHKVWGVR